MKKKDSLYTKISQPNQKSWIQGTFERADDLGGWVAGTSWIPSLFVPYEQQDKVPSANSP